MPAKTVFILSASSDIGRELAERYSRDGFSVVGTYRDPGGAGRLAGRPDVALLACDVVSRESVRAMVDAYAAMNRPWDVLISSVGQLEPIGPFFSLDFDRWEESIRINFTAQLRVLHALYPYRRQGRIGHVAFFAGGGTNNPFPNFSAYCVSKIGLIKMCELLDDEAQDLNVFIVGPGFLPTKIHQQTLRNPAGAGRNYDKMRAFFEAEQPHASYEDIYQCINWCIGRGRLVAGGRNFSAVHDPWREGGGELATELEADPNKFKLRRFRNESPGREGA